MEAEHLLFPNPPVQNPYLVLVNDHTRVKRLPGENLLFYSELRQRYTYNSFRRPGLKYVVEGTERYRLGAKEYKVSAKQFLLCNTRADTPAIVDSRQTVKGICVDISPQLIRDAFHFLSSVNTIDLDQSTFGAGDADFFFEQVTGLNGTLLSNRIQRLEKHLLAKEYQLPFLDEAWFFETAEELILEQFPKWHCVNRLKFRKTETRKEVFRRLYAAKEFMDTCFLEKTDIKTLAGISMLSEFHFFRSFKDAFGITPHRYLQNRKLEYAWQLLSKRSMSPVALSAQLGFSDAAAFSNAFRKRFGYPPVKTPAAAK